MTDDTELSVPARFSMGAAHPAAQGQLARWLLANRVTPEGPEAGAVAGKAKTHRWWAVMALTGVDYFSTLSYLPGIAAVAAGALSPLATLLIVALTLFGMLPMYRRVAKESPNGQGSVAMLERLLPFWKGKIFVLVLLGFVATSWIITMTLSAADATVHLIENPLVPDFFSGAAVPVTVALLLILGGVFLLGFTEAVNVAIPLVVAYLGLNAVIVAVGIGSLLADPVPLSNWTTLLSSNPGSGFEAIRTAAIAFPLLVLGLSGFETGVSMMPLISAEGFTDFQRRSSRVRNTRKLLTTAALIMSVYLMATTFITTVLIPPAAFEEGGEANGRALAYLAHAMLGEGFGTVYDFSSVLILWFAGASAMAGLINIVPRYLPQYGMAPEWSKAVRPVVLVYTGVSILITIAFNADVDAQAGAYATGILAMMVSGAIAVTISAARSHRAGSTLGFGILTMVLSYALVDNIFAAPDGLAISAVFVAGIIIISLVSRVYRATELRVDSIEFSHKARLLIAAAIESGGEIDIIANRREGGGTADYTSKQAAQRGMNPVEGHANVLFLEVDVMDPSDFSRVLLVRGYEIEGHNVLRVESPAVPNAIAAVLIALRDLSGTRPHCYFEWSEGNPIGHLFRYLLLGRGDTAPVVREILRELDADPLKRPAIHVGG